MAANTVIFASNNPAVIVEALLDTDGAKVTGGYGGWEIINRPRRQSITHWGGRNPFTMPVSIILDGFRENIRVEADCTKLERLALPHPNPGGVPPIITVSGNAVPHNDLQWVVENIDWGDVIRDIFGYRVRQHAVVNLLRYVATDKIQLTAAENTRNKTTAKETEIYTVRVGDTMASVAARKLGDAGRWKEILKLNPSLRDPNRLIEAKTIKIPHSNTPPKATPSKPGPAKPKTLPADSGGRRGGV